MSEVSNKSLFFIISPDKKLTAIESFLKKRNYKVYIESDLKDALIRLIEIQPDFVFLALDHLNPKVSSLSKIIDQSIITHLIPFVHSSAREEIRKLNYGGFTHKIFPPLSGPGIERLVLKIEKEKSAEALQDALAQKSYLVENQTEIVKIKQMAVDHYNSTVVSADEEEQQKIKMQKSSVIIQKGARAQLLKSKNEFLTKVKKSSLSEAKKKEIKKDLETQIKSELLDLIQTYQQDEEPNEQNKVVSIDNNAPVVEAKSSIAKCLLIQSEKWCGYLVAYSNIEIELSALEPILKNWVNQRFENLLESDDSDYFEMKINPETFKAWAPMNAELYDSIQFNQTEIFISFFGIDPSELIMTFDEENELIEIQLDLIPIDEDLQFSLHLHLPENKKFLLYTPAYQKLSPTQKKRLQDKKVDRLFTPAVFEKECKKLIIEHELKNLIEEIQIESL